jgi:outer membrane lipoprotein-sorting protein
MSNTVALEAELKGNAQKIKTITSDFTQVKQMKMLQDKVTSKGRFSFMQPDKIRIEYTSPFQYLLVMAGGNVLVKDGKRTKRMNIRNNDAMQSVNQVLMDCMRGTVFANKDFKANAWLSVGQYKIRLTPNDASVRKILAWIEIYLNKSDMQVTKLVMKEQSGDETDMIFSNTQNNTSLSDALFRVH